MPRTLTRTTVAPAVAVEVVLPLRTYSEANRRDHWTIRRSRNESARVAWRVIMHNYRLTDALAWICPEELRLPPAVVTLTRLGPRLLDDDNLASALKALRDAVALSLKVDDGDTRRVVWQYGQVISPLYGVRVRIEAADG